METCNAINLQDVYQTLFNTECTLAYIQIQRIQAAPGSPEFTMRLGIVTGTNIDTLVLYYMNEVDMLVDRDILSEDVM